MSGWLEKLERYRALRWLIRSARGFVADGCTLHAAALTYSSALALVPLLAVVLAILKGAGFEQQLRPFLLDSFPVLPEDAIDQLMDYIARANARAVGGVGLAALLYTSWNMLGSIESALNHIFGVSRSRGYARRTGEYLSMLMVGSAMLVITMAVQTVLGSETLFHRFLGDQIGGGAAWLGLALMPWVTVWLGFTFLYAWMPNTRVRIGSLLVGGLVAGTLFQLLQRGYIEIQIAFGSYHAVYGALAQLPVFLVWVYLSWSVTLLGAEAADVHRTLDVGVGDGSDPAEGRLGLEVLRRVAAAFYAGQPTPRAEELAVELGVSALTVQAAVAPLVAAGVLVEPEDEHGYLFASAPATIALERVLAAVGSGDGSVAAG